MVGIKKMSVFEEALTRLMVRDFSTEKKFLGNIEVGRELKYRFRL